MDFTPEHFAERLRRIRHQMAKDGFDAVVFCKCETVRYVTGFRRWYSYSWFYLREFALVSATEGPLLMTDKGRMARARENCFVTGVADSHLWPIPRDDRDAPLRALIAGLQDIGVRTGRIGLEFDALPVDFYLRLGCYGGCYQFDDFSPSMNRVIMIKFGEEIDVLRQTGRLADIGLEAGVRAAGVGRTEQQVAAEIDYAMMSAGAERVSHNVVRTGTNVTALNNIQTLRSIDSGDLIQLDLGSVHSGYFSDVNLTYVLDRPTPQQHQVAEVALRMERAGLEAVRPGLSLHELRCIMKTPAVEAGLDQYTVADIGHGIGIYHQEFPKVAEDDCALQPGMVLCLEPGLVIPGVAAARKEDMVLVTESGHEMLTEFMLA